MAQGPALARDAHHSEVPARARARPRRGVDAAGAPERDPHDVGRSDHAAPTADAEIPGDVWEPKPHVALQRDRRVARVASVHRTRRARPTHEWGHLLSRALCRRNLTRGRQATRTIPYLQDTLANPLRAPLTVLSQPTTLPLPPLRPKP